MKKKKLLFPFFVLFFTVINCGVSQAPAIFDINPKTGKQTGGTKITITGENFIVGNTKIKIGNEEILNILEISENKIIAITPACNSKTISEMKDITIITENGSFIKSKCFKYFKPCFVVANNFNNKLTMVFSDFTVKYIPTQKEFNYCAMAYGNGKFIVSGSSITIIDLSSNDNNLNTIPSIDGGSHVLFDYDKFFIYNVPNIIIVNADTLKILKKLYCRALCDMKVGNGHMFSREYRTCTYIHITKIGRAHV